MATLSLKSYIRSIFDGENLLLRINTKNSYQKVLNSL